MRYCKIRGLLASLLVMILLMGAGVCPASALTLTGKGKKVSYENKYVGKHKRLHVKGKYLVDYKGRKVQLKGVSTHGINWDVGYPYVNEEAFCNLRDEWGVNCIRVAMYTEDYNGYCVTDAAGRKKLLETIDAAVKATKKLGMYVIIDWHILNDQNPKKHQKEANRFFKKVAKKYKNCSHVLYEICNEPNGSTTWSDVKSYAKSVVKTIRSVDKKAVIIVGTPTWSQDVDVASKSPLKGAKNIMYSFHFYAATHKESYREKVKTALNNGLPVICTEFSACEASGNGAYDFSSANSWMKLMDKNHISYCCWSLSNKPESASLLDADCKKTSGFHNSDVSKMGKWMIKKYIRD